MSLISRTHPLVEPKPYTFPLVQLQLEAPLNSSVDYAELFSICAQLDIFMERQLRVNLNQLQQQGIDILLKDKTCNDMLIELRKICDRHDGTKSMLTVLDELNIASMFTLLTQVLNAGLAAFLDPSPLIGYPPETDERNPGQAASTPPRRAIPPGSSPATGSLSTNSTGSSSTRYSGSTLTSVISSVSSGSAEADEVSSCSSSVEPLPPLSDYLTTVRFIADTIRCAELMYAQLNQNFHKYIPHQVAILYQHLRHLTGVTEYRQQIQRHFDALKRHWTDAKLDDSEADWAKQLLERLLIELYQLAPRVRDSIEPFLEVALSQPGQVRT
eukprot:gnl/Trimastix_PCT/2582.p1 GENE.gnl/Trimastix_PCT/2582~~gnl/Trimastix_PCT/2582.p1  ORF type:complete len:328 (+),score=24.74 gnl/Trimastix_PCT/2582:66-1049(+)